MELTNEDVADILALLDSLPYDELDLQTSRFRLTLRRGPDGGWTESRTVTAEPEALPPAASAAGNDAGGAHGTVTGASPGDGARGGPGAETESAGLVDVTAPLPGTFYRAPRPGAAPFVEVGSQVSVDTVVAIVETMKGTT